MKEFGESEGENGGVATTISLPHMQMEGQP